MANPEVDLDFPFFEVEGKGHDCVSLDFGQLFEFQDFRLVQKEFPVPSLRMIVDIAMGVRGDEGVFQPGLTGRNAYVIILKGGMALLGRLHFRSEESDARFEGFQDFKMVKSSPVGCKFIREMFSHGVFGLL